jgi:hypothetical protein
MSGPAFEQPRREMPKIAASIAGFAINQPASAKFI